MPFNSYIFIFGFLPVALVVTYVAGRRSQGCAKAVLCLLSLGFYAWADRRSLPLLVGVTLFNFLIGRLILKAREHGRAGPATVWLSLGVAVDLGLLVWFKYADFWLSGFGGGRLAHIALPLAISFFTFQFIGYLMDVSRSEAGRIGLLDFSLFATFFPRLISGPIVHFKEFVPQVLTRRFGRLNWRNILVGLVIFAIGLFKKSVIADTLSAYAVPLFPEHAAIGAVGLVGGWLAAVTFTFQLYFDFSGYSDMAIGVARMLGIKLPLNFHSPLRAASIIEYWRRWHMTLQRFIVAYVFQPLSLPLNRLAARWGLGRWGTFALGSCAPTIATFLAIGVWHGAGWTFAIFGLMHAAYVCVNEGWRENRKLRRRKLKKAGKTLPEPGVGETAAYHALTLAAVAYANVIFRASSLPAALAVWAGMSGLGGLGALAPDLGLLATLAAALALVVLPPNTQQIMARFDPAENWREWRTAARPPLPWTWKPTTGGLVFAGAVLFFGLMFIQRGQAAFLYFKF